MSVIYINRNICPPKLRKKRKVGILIYVGFFGGFGVILQTEKIS